LPPPEAESVVLLPLQMDVFDADALMFGNALTCTTTLLVLLQPNASVPVTVYVVVAVGFTLMIFPCIFPGIHV
jgi:hypothetical protein